MTSPSWARLLLRVVAPPHRTEELLGDLEESHALRRANRSGPTAWLLTSVEASELAGAVLLERIRRRTPEPQTTEEASRTDLLGDIGVSWLDFKLGFRMLVRFPGLTVVATVAIAFAIAIGAGTYDFFEKVTSPTMPFEGGDRIYYVFNRSNRDGDISTSASLHDFYRWRDDLESVDAIGAWHPFQRNLIAPGGSSESRLGAAVTADLLAMPGIDPMLGRRLTSADEVDGAPDVVILGYDVWRTQFGMDDGILGTVVRIGRSQATVVGVMPEGFEWPRAYELWTPMRFDPIDFEVGSAPAVTTAARLRAGVDPRTTQAELEAIGARAAADHPETHGHLRPDMNAFGAIELPVSGIATTLFYSLSVAAFAGLMLLVCGNIALLLFARTSARQSEIVVRSALGASRGRVVAQLFIEALLLAVVGAGLGLWGAQEGLRWVVRTMQNMGEGQFGFWFYEPLGSKAALFAMISAIGAAVICGVVPALKVTGRQLSHGLQRSGGGVDKEFGRLWSGIVIAQIAATVAFAPLVLYLGVETSRIRTADFGFSAHEFLAVEFAAGGEWITLVETPYATESTKLLDSDPAVSVSQIMERLRAEAGVAAVAAGTQTPGPYHPWHMIEMDGPAAPPPSAAGHRVRTAAVDENFFDALGVGLTTGRGFTSADATEAEPLVIVNQDFVDVVLEGRSAVGRRFRFRDPTWREGEELRMGPWHQIIGVVPQVGMQIDPELPVSPGFYTPLPTAGVNPLRVAVRTRGRPEALVARVRELAAEVDPTLLVTDVRPMSDAAWQARVAYSSWFWVVLIGGGIGLLLATVGIYSVMAFTVSRRTREIGVRVALGADRATIAAAVLRRAARQIAVGVVIGGTVIASLVTLATIQNGAITRTALDGIVLAAYLVVMAAVVGVACIVPTMRALRVEPTEALRSE